MKDWGKRFDDKWNTLDKNGGFIHMITLNTHNPEAIKHFLATALEEQRAEYVRKVEGMKLDHTPVTHRIDAYNDAIIDVLAILNGKGTE